MAAQTDSVMSFFPYQPRTNQEDAVRFAHDLFRNGNIGLLSADCGVGKTVAVLSGFLAARAYDPNSRLLVLTRTHSQSDVFENEISILRQIRRTTEPLTATTLVSRVHMCPVHDSMGSVTATGFLRACSLMVRTGKCVHFWNLYGSQSGGRPQLRPSAQELVRRTLDEGVVTRALVESVAEAERICPYELMRWCARASRIVIGPYTYVFKTRVREALLQSLGVSLRDVDLLVDEAHNLPSSVLDIESAALSGEDVQWLRHHGSEIAEETGMEWLPEVITFLHETLMLSLDNLRGRTEIQLDCWEAVPRYVGPAELEQLMSVGTDTEDIEVHRETPLDRLMEYLHAGLMASRNDEWHISLVVGKRWTDMGDLSDVSLSVRPLNASGLCAPILRGVRSAVLMSGTLRPVTHYARLMGISGSRSLDLSSPYPRGSRLVLIDRDIDTSYRRRGSDMWRAVAERVSALLGTMPADKSALIAFPSYSIMDYVLSFNIDLGHRQRIVENRDCRIEDLRAEMEASPCAVFLVYSGKFSEGADLVENGRSMVNLIVGVGIPFAPPSSYQTALERFYDSRFWHGAGYYLSSVMPAVRSAVQLVGRLRRSPKDWGVVALLDRRFLRYTDMFGPEMASDMWVYSGVEEAVEAMMLFLESRKMEDDSA
ncbi:MAG: ATP-dependent DNA helicase [Candidatus Thorarchaeota archaeon]